MKSTLIPVSFRHFLIYTLIVLDFNGLGLFPGSDLIQYITMFVLLISVFLVIISQRVFSKFNPLTKIFYALFILFIFSFIVNIFQIAIFQKADLYLLFFNAKGFHRYLLLIIIISFIQSPEELKSVIKGVIFLSIVSGLVIIIFVVFNITYSSIKVLSEGTRGFDKFRVMIPTDILLAFSFFYLLTIFIYKTKNVFLIFSLLIVGFALLIQLHRGVLLSFFISILSLLIIIRYLKTIRPKRYSLSVFFISICILLITVGYLSKIDISYLESIFSISSYEIKENTGTFIGRIDLLINGITFISKNYLLIGIGFNWETVDIDSYLMNSFVSSAVGDNSYYNIVILFGFIGIIIYIIILFKLFSYCLKLIRYSSDKFSILLACSLLLVNIFWVFRAFTGDYIGSSASTTGTIIIWAFVFKVVEYNSTLFQNIKQGIR